MVLPDARDDILFTPGPLTTSRTVKQAMLRDLGSRDADFIAVVRRIRQRLVALAGGQPDHSAVLMQGSGTFAVEAAIGSLLPPDGCLVALVNGAYGRRMVRIAERLGIRVASVESPEDRPVDRSALERALSETPGATHVAVVHCETTTGLLNPVVELAAIVRRRGLVSIVDAMSSFGAVPLDVARDRIDVVVSSSNKCIEGVPGFAFVLAPRQLLCRAEGWARSVSLDLVEQWRGLEGDGQFRFTPPTHALLAFHQALDELDAEGGVGGRMARYRGNHAALMEGMTALGFQPYLLPEHQGWIISTFLIPDHPSFAFERLYDGLKERGCVIYPGKLTQADCFRIGTVGRLRPADVEGLLAAMAAVLRDMGVPTPVPAPTEGGAP